MYYDVIIVGGGPSGIVSASTARNYYPEKSILVINSIDQGVVPCGIPYMFNTLESPEQNALSCGSLSKKNIDVKIGTVTKLDREKKYIFTNQDEEIYYDKLVLACGSNPIMPSIPGKEKKGIYTIIKEMGYLKNLKNDLGSAGNIVIIGGGFIGVEFADELVNFTGKNVTIVELQPEILSNSFDKEFSDLAREKLNEMGVNIINNLSVVKFNGEERVNSVSLSDGQEIPADLVILGIGDSPNSGLALDSGLEIGQGRGILVDEYLRTSDPNIFAVGDCAEKRDFFTRKRINVMLASTATAEARIAGSNLFGIKVVRENKGTIAIYSTKISNLVLGSAGLTEKTASREGFDIFVGEAQSMDKHPGALPGASMIKVKLIFSRQSGLLLGGQVSGGDSVGEMVNIIGLALEKNTTLTELETLQVATHPKLTSAPTMYPLISAAQSALNNLIRKS